MLVTGAAGSIGSQLCERVAMDDARRLTMVSLTEGGLYSVDKHLRHQYGRSRETVFLPVLGSVGNAPLMAEVLADVDIVIHAAAHKHVPLCESNPLEAITNNVIATASLIRACVDAGVKQFCLVSSDKAVRPASIMGATKRAGELIVGGTNSQQCGRFFTVRFGNVLDSAGSVLPLWREQIAHGGPITLTDERCERYFMSIAEAVDLIAGVIGMDPAGGTFVLDMGKPRRLIDIAQELMREVGHIVQIKSIGLRPGEKLTEELHRGGPVLATALPRVFSLVDPSSMRSLAIDELKDACTAWDRRRAVELLWDLVREPEFVEAIA